MGEPRCSGQLWWPYSTLLIPQSAPRECGGHDATNPAAAATAAPVTPRVGCVPVPRACNPRPASSPALLATMALPANSAASVRGHPVTPRQEPASALQGELGPGTRWCVYVRVNNTLRSRGDRHGATRGPRQCTGAVHKLRLEGHTDQLQGLLGRHQDGGCGSRLLDEAEIMGQGLL